MKLLLFDIDGTLLLSRGLGLESLRAAISRVLGPQSASDVRPDGKTDPQILRELLPSVASHDVERIHRRVLEVYLSELDGNLRRQPGRLFVLPGAAATVDRLSRRSDLLLGVATGNIEAAARLKLRAGGLDGYFKTGGFGSDSADRTALIEIAIKRASAGSGTATLDPVVIGDTPRDVEHGRAAGAATVGVATGSYTARQLQQCGADLVLENLLQGEERLLRFLGFES